ncbi:MAG: type II toxin-antitoxin system HicA family toxin [Vibrio sp.]
MSEVTIFVYLCVVDEYDGDKVKQSEFRRWLESQGVEVKQGTNHLKLYYQGKQSTLPRHPSKEIGKGLANAIKTQLNLK